MTRMLRNFIVITFGLTLSVSCSTTARLYKQGHTKKIYSGTLDDSTNASLRQLLATYATSSLNDTIIVKYDYNKESCWDLLDQEDDNYIQGFVTRHTERVQALQATRPNVSYFDFREPGNKVNKLKKWNSSIIIDSSKQLMKLLFKERATCGSSIIVMPDKRFVFIRSDAHTVAMDLTQDKIAEYLARN